MFTTIAKLRASNAQTGRVTTVENWLKKQNAAWTPDAIFPIAFIAHSNSTDDVSWVNGSENTHVTSPALAAAILKQFDHKTQGEHRSAMYNLLNSREGKAKVLAEQIVPKYNAAAISIGYTGVWPFSLLQPAGVEVAATEEKKEEIPSTTDDAATETAQTETATTETATTETAPPVEEKKFSNIDIGAFYVAIGKVIASKDKSFDDACKWAASPTGGRSFTEYVEAFGTGADVKEVRAYLKAHNAKAAA